MQVSQSAEEAVESHNIFPILQQWAMRYVQSETEARSLAFRTIEEAAEGLLLTQFMTPKKALFYVMHSIILNEIKVIGRNTPEATSPDHQS